MRHLRDITETFQLTNIGLAVTLFIDPHMDNERAVRAYEKSGVRKVKPLRAHELQDGEWHDCWLMENRRDKRC